MWVVWVGGINEQVMLIPSTSLSLTARSMPLRVSFAVSFAASTADFCKVTEEEKAARGAEVASVRGSWRVITRRAAASVRKDILGGVGGVLMCVKVVGRLV